MRKRFKLGFIFLVLLSFVLTIIFGLTNPARNTYAAWSGSGDGTSDNPYQISTKAELEKFRDIVNGANGETRNYSACAILTDNIDLNNEEWTPIGTTVYAGTFNGNNKTIEELNVNTLDATSGSGLFARIGNAKIINLSVSGTVNSKGYAAGLVGNINSATNAEITNCHNYVNVTYPSGSDSSTYLGGIVGNISSNVTCTITKCSNHGNITYSGTNSSSMAGGIVGNGQGSKAKPLVLSKCSNYGTISSYEKAGGIAAKLYSSDDGCSISDCYNVGNISARDYVAGILGQEAGCPIAHSFNYGSVYMNHSANVLRGAIFGYGKSGVTSTNCVYLSGSLTRKDASSPHDTEGNRNGFVTGNPLTAEEFKDETIFVSKGYDFENIWMMGTDYPVFRPDHLHNLTYTASGASITATCSAENCTLTDNKSTLTLVAPKNLAYSGSAKVVTFKEGYDTKVFANPTVKYYKDDQVVTECIEKGTYVAKVTFGTATAQLEFTITDHIHGEDEFGAWTANDSLPTTAGNYYLTSDVNIDYTWEIISGTINLCLNGYGIKRTGGGCVIVIYNDATLNVYDCDDSIEHKYSVATAQSNGAGLATVDDSLTSDFEKFTGGYITGGLGAEGAALYIQGTFNMYGGTIIGNSCSDGDGNGAIQVNGGTFTMNGGSIIHNFGRSGGALFVENNSTFNMNGGLIAWNNASVRAGAIFTRGTTKINGGEIKNNWGGEGTIANWGGTIEITGGYIHDNIIGSSSCDVNNTWKIGGNPIIKDNKKTNDEIVGLLVKDGKKMTVSEPLTKGASIGIKMEATGGVGVFTTGWKDVMGYANPADYFVSDVNGLYFGLIDGEAALFNTPQRVRIGGNTYSTLQEAHDAYNDNDVIVLMQDYERETEFGKLECDKTITIDLNGFILKDFDYTVHSISANHDLTIDNSKPEIGGVKVLLSITSDRVSGKIILKNVRIDADKEKMATDMELKPFIHFADGFKIFDFSPSSPDYAEGFRGIIMEYSALDPTEKPTVSNPDHTPVYIGEEITIDVDGTPVEIEWYYVDDDGKPTGNPIGTGKTYKPKSPDDLGKKVIAEIKQYFDENGNPITGTIPTQTTDPIEIFTPFDKDEVIKIIVPGTSPKAGDEIKVSPSFKPATVKWYYDDDEDGKPDSETPIGEGTTYTVVCPDPNNENHDDTGHTIIAVVSQGVDENGDPITGDIPTITTNGVRVYTPLKPEEKVSVTVPGYPVFVGDEILNETKATEATTEWFYDDDKDGNPDSTTRIGTGEKYTVREEDLGHNIIAVMKQNKKNDGTDYEEGEKPTATSLPIKVYTPMGDEEEVAIATTDDKKYPEPGDEIKAEVGFTPSTIKWYYDDDQDGTPDTTTPIGEDSTYEVKDEDRGHNIIAVITQDKKPDGTNYAEGEKPTITSSPVEIYKPLDTQTELDVIIPGNKNNPAAGDDIKVNPNSQPVTVKWYYDDDFDGEPDDYSNPLGTGETYTIKEEDKGHNIIGVITQDKKPDNSDYSETEKPTTTTKPVQVYYPINPDEEVEVNTTNDKERPANGDEITVDPMVTPVTVEWFYDDDQDGTPDSTTSIGTGTTYVVKAPDANNPTHDDTGHTIIGVITQDKKPDGTDYADGEKPTTTTKPIKVKGYLPGEYVPLDEEETPAPTVPNKKYLEDGDEITLETDATDINIEWFYDDDNNGYPDDFLTPIGSGETYTVKEEDRGHNIIAAVTQKYDENGDEYPRGEQPTQLSTTITNIKPLHEHNFTYTAAGATITATCNNPECDITEGLTLTLVAPTGSMVYDGKARVATIQAGYNEEAFTNPVIKYYLGTLEVESCVNDGTYIAKVAYGNVAAQVEFTIENWKPSADVKPSADITDTGAANSIKVEVEGSEVKENISIKVEIKTNVSAQQVAKDYEAIKAKLQNNEEISRVYDVKLIRTVNGVEEEIQPSDVKDGATIVVTITLPDSITGIFKILHIHGPNDMEFIENYVLSGRLVSFKVSRLSEFAFVVKAAPKAGFPGWATALIVIDALLVLLAMTYLALFFIFNKWIVVNGKPTRALICGHNDEGKIRTITLFFQIEYKDEGEVFNSEDEAFNAIAVK